MSRIFLSHSSVNNAEAIALRDWLVDEGWSDLFLDLDPNRGIAAGERWERALNEAARRCEAVLFLISRQWLASRWCMNELTLARRLNKRLFGLLVEEGLAIADLPADVTSHWQLVNLATGRDHQQFRVTLPVTGEEQHVTYSYEGLSRLKAGLQRAGLHANYFAWPPETDPKRAPYRGLRPLEADDAGIFFGREAPVIEAIDRLRGLTEAAPPRLMVILGASGAGKSSFLRAGLLPRLGRDPQTFLPLPVIRPERAAISGETGLVSALAGAFEVTPLKVARGEIREAVAGGAAMLKPLLARLQDAAQPPTIDSGAAPKLPTLVLAIDQCEELFLAEAQGEAQPFLVLLRDLVISDKPAVTAVFTIRSDNYERLQSAAELDGVHKMPLDLGPMPKGSYAEVVKGPIRRLDGTARTIKIDDALVEALLADIEAGGAKDALPLLAFTLERLYQEYGATSHLTLDQFNKLGRVKGSIEAAVERAFAAADKDTRIPRDREARLTLLRRGLIPWLAGIDPDTKAPRRRVARLSEIPAEARPLIDLLVEQRLLSTDVAKDTGEITIEPAHEALLRQWGLLQGWLSDDTGLLTVLDGIKRAARDWAANDRRPPWRVHAGERLAAARRLMSRTDLVAHLTPTDQDYFASCDLAQLRRRRKDRRSKVVVGTLVASVIGVGALAYFKILDPSYIEGQYNGFRNRMADASLKRGDTKHDCSRPACPEMIVIPPGQFLMGEAEVPRINGLDFDSPQRLVTIAYHFLVSRYEVTFDEWDACVIEKGCSFSPNDYGFGRGRRPVVGISWKDIQEYLSWLSLKSGMEYRLLSEAEWEYAARGVINVDSKHFKYSWGDSTGIGNANCDGCGSKWDNRSPAPVGTFAANEFGLHDMHGNAREWVADPPHRSYHGAPSDGSVWSGGEYRDDRIVRGGAWNIHPAQMTLTYRAFERLDVRNRAIGFRIARSLSTANAAPHSQPLLRSIP